MPWLMLCVTGTVVAEATNCHKELRMEYRMEYSCSIHLFDLYATIACYTVSKILHVERIFSCACCELRYA